MGSMNRVILLGNLGADAEVKGSGDVQVLKLKLATTDSWTKDGQKQERTEWHQVTMFGKNVSKLATYLTKGKSILVEGSLRTSSYEKDGQKKWTTEIVAKEIVFAGSGGATKSASQEPIDQETEPSRSIEETPF